MNDNSQYIQEPGILNPCPFCGNTNLMTYADKDDVTVYCNKCATYGPLAMTEKYAIEAWNRRVVSSDAKNKI